MEFGFLAADRFVATDFDVLSDGEGGVCSFRGCRVFVDFDTVALET
jgi:hypothetical protein